MGTIRAINSGRYSWVKPYAKSALRQVADVARKYATKRVRDLTSTIFQPKKKPRKSPKRGFVTSGSYKGRFRGRSKRYSVSTVAPKSKDFYAKRGITYDVETNGSISDANCVYLGHCSFSPYYLVNMATMAILRRLLSVGLNWTPNSIEQVIPSFAGGTTSQHFHLRFTSVNIQSSFETIFTYQPTSGDTISSIALFNTVQDFFQTVATGLSQKLKSVTMVEGDVGGTGQGNITMATLDLSTATISYFAKSELKVQNVTTPDAINLESTDVNNVPLVGKMYSLSTPFPDTRGLVPLKLNWVNAETGTIAHFAGDASQPSYNALKEPPAAGFFDRCKAATKLRLEPGAIKASMVSSSGTMNLGAFLQAVAYHASSSKNSTSRLGGCKVLALERVISVQGTLPIKLFYENNVSMGCQINVRKQTFTLGGFSQLNPAAIGPT